MQGYLLQKIRYKIWNSFEPLLFSLVYSITLVILRGKQINFTKLQFFVIYL